MATIAVHNLAGEEVGTLELPDGVFGAVNEDLLWEAVKHYRASARAGTHATKNRRLVSGSGKKLWRQKGTGRARVGSIRSPLWRHGGTVHGPQPRSYAYAFPRKKLLGALRSALAAKHADGKLVVVSDFSLADHKTHTFRRALQALHAGATTLVVSNEANRNLELASRNCSDVLLLRTRDLHPYHLLRFERAIFGRAELERLEQALAGSLSVAAAQETEAAR